MNLSAHILFISLALVWSLSACQVQTIHDDSPSQDFKKASDLGENSSTKAKLKADIKSDERYSLAEDRTKFDQLRTDIPKATQIRNDEKSLYYEWMNDFTIDPQDIRSKYSDLVSKKRDKFNDDLSKIRDEYNKDEEKRKSIFSKELDQDRAELKNKKMSREDREESYGNLETKRKDFYAKLREDRDDFESDYRQRRKDFEDYVKEKYDTFNAELKKYTEKYNSLQKSKENNY